MTANLLLNWINAVYFKAGWTIPFSADLTHQLYFMLTPDSYELRDFMITDTLFQYYENDLFQAVDLPYGDKKFSMTVFLPKDLVDVDDFIAQITDENYAAWLKSSLAGIRLIMSFSTLSNMPTCMQRQ